MSRCASIVPRSLRVPLYPPDVKPWSNCVPYSTYQMWSLEAFMYLIPTRCGALAPFCAMWSLGAYPLQDLAVPQDFYSSLSLSLEWSGWPPHLMVWDLWVSRAGPRPFCWPCFKTAVSGRQSSLCHHAVVGSRLFAASGRQSSLCRQWSAVFSNSAAARAVVRFHSSMVPQPETGLRCPCSSKFSS